MTSLDVRLIEQEALDLTRELCRKPSVSAEERALDETAELVETLLTTTGFETRQLEVDGAPPAVYGELQGEGEATLLLYNHYDVQPVDPIELWESPPFEPTLRDDRLYARGAADNKAEIGVRLATIRALREARGGPPLTIRWIIEGEEEVASPHFEAIVERNVELLRADGCLWEGSGLALDGRPEIGLGFKGNLAVKLDIQALSSDAHSGLAGVLPSAAWRLHAALASIRAGDGSVLVRGFHDAVREPTASEREAIAEQGPSVEEELREFFGVERFVDGLSGFELRERLTFTPTCNICGIHAGYAGPGIKTVLPAHASAWMDFRLVPDQRPAEVFELLGAHLDAEGFSDVALTFLASAEPAATPLEDPFAARVIGVAERVTGKPPSIFPIGPASLPIVASLQRHVGVPGLSAPDNPVYGGSAAHAPNEHVRVADFAPAIEFTIALLEELGRTQLPKTTTTSE
jgi:acetylornithine deacetylase/succinyl-diaminopimelate desuccinylase-like protein